MPFSLRGNCGLNAQCRPFGLGREDAATWERKNRNGKIRKKERSRKTLLETFLRGKLNEVGQMATFKERLRKKVGQSWTAAEGGPGSKVDQGVQHRILYLVSSGMPLKKKGPAERSLTPSEGQGGLLKKGKLDLKRGKQS